MDENKKTGKMRKLLELYLTFFRIGIFTFGGGLTMLPMLKYELVEKKKWIEEERLLECYAIGQCTPGIIAVNTATYVGTIKSGIAGGIFATLGMATPSVVIITVVASFLKNVIGYAVVQHALMGIRGAVCALMLNTVYSLARKSLVNPACAVICLSAFVLALCSEVPTILIIILAGIAGVILDRVMGGTVK